MYKRVKTHKTANLMNGGSFTPVVTMEDGHGGRAHIAIDDRCYVLYLEQTERLISNGPIKTFCVPVKHIFHEAFEILKKLPSPTIGSVSIPNTIQNNIKAVKRLTP